MSKEHIYWERGQWKNLVYPIFPIPYYSFPSCNIVLLCLCTKMHFRHIVKLLRQNQQFFFSLQLIIPLFFKQRIYDCALVTVKKLGFSQCNNFFCNNTKHSSSSYCFFSLKCFQTKSRKKNLSIRTFLKGKNLKYTRKLFWVTVRAT